MENKELKGLLDQANKRIAKLNEKVNRLVEIVQQHNNEHVQWLVQTPKKKWWKF